MFVPLKMRIYEIIPIIIIIGFNRVAIEFRASESLLTGRSIIKEFNNWKISEEDCVFIYIRRGYFWIVVKGLEIKYESYKKKISLLIHKLNNLTVT